MLSVAAPGRRRAGLQACELGCHVFGTKFFHISKLGYRAARPQVFGRVSSLLLAGKDERRVLLCRQRISFASIKRRPHFAGHLKYGRFSSCVWSMKRNWNSFVMTSR